VAERMCIDGRTLHREVLKGDVRPTLNTRHTLDEMLCFTHLSAPFQDCSRGATA